MVTVRVLLVFVAFRFKFKVLCTYSVFILLSRKKFPWSPNGLLIRTTRKETPSCVTPVHLPHTDTHARRHTEPRARLLPSGRGAGARGHRSHTGRRSGAELRPWAPRVPGDSWSAAVSSASETVGFHRLGTAFLISLEMWLPPQTCRILNSHLMFDLLCNFFFLTQHCENQ